MEAPPTVYTAALFVRSDIEDFACFICANIVKAPVQCQNGHEYCTSCIEKWKQNSTNACPTCKVSLNMLVPNRAVENNIANSIVYCYTRLPSLIGGTKVNDEGDENIAKSNNSSSDGAVAGNHARIRCCPWKGKLKDADNHFRECDFAGVKCDFEGCGLVVVRSELAEHRKGCDHRMLTCKSNGCSQQLKRTEMDQHQLVCPKRMTICPNPGCSVFTAFDSMFQHQIGCPKRLCMCDHPGCGQLFAFDSMDQHKASHNALPGFIDYRLIFLARPNPAPFYSRTN